MKNLNSFLSEGREWFDRYIKTIHEYANKLQESEEWLSTTLRSIGDAVIATDIKGNVTFLNTIAESLTGWKKKEGVGKPIGEIFKIINGQSRKPVENPVTQVIREGVIVGLANDTILISKEGKEIPINDSGAPIKDNDGNVMGVVLVFRDISERKKLEEDLSVAYDAISSSINGVIITNREGKITYANPSFIRMFEYNSKEGVLGKTASELFPHEKIQKFSDVTAIIDKVKGNTEEFVVRRNNGSEFPVEVSSSIVTNKMGSEIGRMASFKDISERKKLEEQNKNYSIKLEILNQIISVGHIVESLQGLLDAILDLILDLTDFDGGGIYILNKEERVAELLNHRGLPMEFVEAVRKCPIDQEPYTILFHDSQPIFSENWVKNDPVFAEKSGFLALASIPIFLKDDVIGAINVASKKRHFFSDFEKDILQTIGKEVGTIIAKMQLEEELIIHKIQLGEKTGELKNALDVQKGYLDQIIKASQYKTEFMTSMSHDLRTPLNSIIGFTDLLLEQSYGLLNEDQLGCLKDVQDSSQFLLEMINKILDISSIETGEVHLEYKKISLNSLIIQISTSIKPMCLQKNLEFKVESIKSDKMINVDPIRFKQILYNLITNAIKYTNRGRITLDIKEDKNQWTFNVIDTGIGISKEDQKDIFQGFKRVDSSFVQSVPGMGLGLLLAKRLVNLHGGVISVKSKLRKGTTFSFIIPKK